MIHLYKKPDIDILIHIWLSASIKAHSFISSSYWLSKTNEMKNIYIPASETYVFEEELSKEIKGFISLIDNYVAALFVDPQYQGQGIGRKLVDFAKSNRINLELTVYKENVLAIEFYKKQGFIEIGEQVDPHTKKEEIIMKWNRSE